MRFAFDIMLPMPVTIYQPAPAVWGFAAAQAPGVIAMVPATPVQPQQQMVIVSQQPAYAPGASTPLVPVSGGPGAMPGYGGYGSTGGGYGSTGSAGAPPMTPGGSGAYAPMPGTPNGYGPPGGYAPQPQAMGHGGVVVQPNPLQHTYSQGALPVGPGTPMAPQYAPPM